VRRRRLSRVPRRRSGQQARAADVHQCARGVLLGRKLARQNSAELAALPDVPGPEHIIAFAESARSYGRRLPLSWDLPHHRYRGTDVTVGAMAGAACAEWHLHAWDLARSLGKDYRPADPELVLTAWRAGTPQLWPVLTGWAGDDPWHFLLTASGRDPGWLQMLERVESGNCTRRQGQRPARRRSRVFGS